MAPGDDLGIDNQSTVSEQKDADQLPSIRAIATDVDFKPYLEAVNSASQRTRSIIYVLIAALLLMFTALRNTVYPDWTDARLSRLQLALGCVRQGGSFDNPECKAAVDYSVQYLFQGTFSNKSILMLAKSKLFEEELAGQIDEFIRQRTDADIVRLPFFGIAIDLNDLGNVGGLLLVSILYVLYASLSREIDNVERAKNKALTLEGKTKKNESLELLLMAQVFASPSKSKLHVSRGIYVLFVLVPMLHLVIVLTDSLSLNTASVLQGAVPALVETILEWVIFSFVASCSYLCCRQQQRLNNNLGSLAVYRE
jgi:hypothetical protein